MHISIIPTKRARWQFVLVTCGALWSSAMGRTISHFWSTTWYIINKNMDEWPLPCFWLPCWNTIFIDVYWTSNEKIWIGNVIIYNYVFWYPPDSSNIFTNILVLEYSHILNGSYLLHILHHLNPFHILISSSFPCNSIYWNLIYPFHILSTSLRRVNCPRLKNKKISQNKSSPLP